MNFVREVQRRIAIFSMFLKKRTTTMTFRMATPEETKARYGKPLIFFGVKPPASWGAKSPSTTAETPEVLGPTDTTASIKGAAPVRDFTEQE